MNDTKFNFPIKYAAMPIRKDDTILAYIACKCYVIEYAKRYLKYGEYDSYKIVYFYNDNFKKTIPLFKKAECINSINTELVFNTLEECQRYTRARNDQLMFKKLSDFDSNNIDEKTKLYDKYYELETYLLKNSDSSNIINLNEYKKIRKVGR